MLSESLKAVIAQVLLPKANGKGRVAAHEIMINNVAVGNLIRENKIFQIKSTMQISKNDGMQTMDDCLTRLMNDGSISVENGKALMGKSISGAINAATGNTPAPSAAAKSSNVAGIPGMAPGVPSNNPFVKKSS